jgi:hypothetical protein
MNDLRQRLYRIFDPAPLAEDDKREALYVPLESARGNSPVVEMLAPRIELSETNTVQLLAGHPGSGKSTELHRLRKHLESQNQFVVFCDVAQSGRDVDLSDFAFPELLVVMLRDLVEALEPLNITLDPSYFADLFPRFKNLLFTKFDIKKLTLKAGLVELAAAVRTPDSRHKIREIIAPSAKDWLAAANDAFDDARKELKKKNKAGLTLLVDGLDKLVDDQRNAPGWRDNLYMDRRPEMGGFRANVVYTIPIDLVLTSRGNIIANLYEMSQIPVVPMVKLRDPPPKTKVYTPGVNLFKEVVARRLEQAQVPKDKVFAPRVLDQMIKLSGGQLRQLMIMVRDACARSLPVKSETVESVIRGYRLQYSYWLGPTHHKLLQQAGKSGDVPPTDENRDALRELLESRALLHYRNTGQWYGLNPLLPPLPGITPARRSGSKKQ